MQEMQLLTVFTVLRIAVVTAFLVTMVACANHNATVTLRVESIDSGEFYVEEDPSIKVPLRVQEDITVSVEIGETTKVNEKVFDRLMEKGSTRYMRYDGEAFQEVFRTSPDQKVTLVDPVVNEYGPFIERKAGVASGDGRKILIYSVLGDENSE